MQSTESQLALFDYAALAPEVRDEVQVRTAAIRGRLRSAAEDIVAIGGELVAVKAALGHGQFGAWLTSEFGWSDRAARQFMAVYERFKSANFSDLTFGPSALYVLASPSVSDEARQEALERAEQGQPITRKTALDIVARHREPVQDEPDEPQDVSPAQWECDECGELFDELVWHCKGCDHHWIVGLLDHCKNCYRDADESPGATNPQIAVTTAVSDERNNTTAAVIRPSVQPQLLHPQPLSAVIDDDDEDVLEGDFSYLDLPSANRGPEEKAWSDIVKLGALVSVVPAEHVANNPTSEIVAQEGYPEMLRGTARWIDRVADAVEARLKGSGIRVVGGRE